MHPRFPKSRSLLLMALVLLCSLAWSGAQTVSRQERVAKGPVIQNVTTDRATVTWVTHKVVGWIQKEGDESRRIVEEPVYHDLELAGLQPATRYRFDLEASGANVAVNFTTAPKGDAPFTFIVLGDTRTRHEIHKKAVERILNEKPSFVVHTGDLVGYGFNAEDWDKFFEIEKDLLRNIPFYPVIGNHEANAPVFFRYFAFPGGDGRHYSFDWGNAHIVAIDANEMGATSQPAVARNQAIIDWLREDLSRNRKPLTFVCTHQPLISAIPKREAAAAAIAAKLEPVLGEGGVTAVFSGHDHNYQHHLRDGLRQIVTGGGGAPLYDVNPIPGITLKAVKSENYVRVRIEGKKAHIEAVDLDGNLLDSFDLQGR